MLDLTGLPALDLALGLAFIFFLVASLAATIQELIASFLGLRARTLEQGLRSLLEDPKEGWKYVDRFYDHPLIASLYRTPSVFDKPKAEGTDEKGRNERKGKRGPIKRAAAFVVPTRGPSYISPRSFALIVLGDHAGGALPEAVQQRIAPLVADAAGAAETLRTNLEAFYDDTMARVSGWYKRKTQIMLIVIGALLVPAVNVNTLTMAERMWKDETVRSAVVAQAQAVASATPDPAQPKAPATQRLTDAADDVDKVVKVGIPMGWRGEAVPRGAGEIVTAIGGWVLTILAISLGAPFWFDTLGRLARLRSSGKPETPLPASGSGKPNERILTPPQSESD
jgi:hypothetical protein